MSFFKRSNEPTARETFLVSALTASGFTVEQIDEAQAANATDFLKALDKSEAIAAELTSAKASVESLTSTVSALGFEAKDYANADAIKAAFKAKVDSEAARLAVDISASRGIAPVEQAASNSATSGKVVTSAQFNAMSHTERNTFMRSGGKIEG